MLNEVSVYQLAETAVVLDVAACRDADNEARLQNLISLLTEQIAQEQTHQSSKINKQNQLEDIVPGFLNLTLFTASAQGVNYWLPRIHTLWEQAKIQLSYQQPANAKHINIPVIYGNTIPEFGPDLKQLAKARGLTQEQVISLHSKSIYPIYFLGFQPGFAYLGGLSERLHTPRLAKPRVKIPAGSVAIGGETTGVYPADSPGGWHIIGRTNLNLFDSSLTPPNLFTSGDTVRFIPVTSFNSDNGA